MKTLLIAAISNATLAFFTGCDQKSPDNQEKDNSTVHQEVQDEAASDTKRGDSVATVITHYLHLKDALTKDDSKEAAAAGNAMAEAVANVDKTNFNEQQQKAFSEVAEDVKMHGEHIGENEGNIAHQREHFDMLSNDMYDLAKAFAGSQKLYKIHCPMYNNKKGADWLSQDKTVKNPYYGKKMLTCGVVKEEL